MTHSPHKLLSQVFKHKRDAESDILQQLTTYQETLSNILKQTQVQFSVLQNQRELKMNNGAQATELMMIEQSLSEHQQHINEVGCELNTLELAIKQQKKKWIDQHKKCKAHEKMQQQVEYKEKFSLDQKRQANLDETYSSTLFARSRA